MAGGLSAMQCATAATVVWTGAGADSNWTTSGNWNSTSGTYFNDADFAEAGGHTNLSNYSVDNILNAQTGVAQMPIYMLRMYPTNRNFTTMIGSGQAIYTGAGAGDLYVGADTVTASYGYPNIQETITFVGTNALLAITGTLHLGQGLDYAQTIPASTNYVTLNMSGLDNFVMMTNIAAGTVLQGITVANKASGSTANTRFLVCGQIHSYSQGAVYLAKTNIIDLGNDMEIGAMSTFSNSMPCPLYLGMVNSVLVGNAGAANGLVTIGSRGNTNAFVAFNPAFLGGANPPTASFASPSSINGGRVTTFYICLATGGVIPASGYANFSGGNVSAMVTTLQLGTSGTNGIGALGVLTYDNGVFNVNNALVGDQTVSYAASGTSGAPGVGIINLNTNSTYGANATLIVNNVLTLGAVTGTPTAGTAGTVNVAGGTLIANVITNNGASATVNMTNGTWQISVTNAALTNMTVTSFNAGGPTNMIDVSFITPLLGSAYPVRFHLISAANITGGATLGLTLPASYEPGVPYAGYLDYTSNPGLVDLVLTSGPSSARLLTWSGSAADGFWDVASTSDWLNNGSATTYNQYDLVTFADIASTDQTNVSLTTSLTPYSVTVSNNASLYTFSGSGNLSGVATLVKTGANTLILDNTTPNNFTGGVIISGGMLQIGTNDTGGSLPIGPVVDNSILAYDRTDSVTVSDVISGSGAVVSAGGGVLQLDAVNTFTGPAIATNNSTLQGGIAGAFGGAGGTVVIANGSTLDPDGVGTGRAVTVSGTGVNGAGAIVNSGGAIYDSSGGLTSTLTLAGNTTLSFPTRWDLGSSTGVTLSTGSQPYNLTLNGNGYFEWRDVKTDAQLANIYLAAGTFGYTGSSTAGNPSSSLVISNGTTLQFYPNDGYNAVVNKQVIQQDGGLIINSGAGGAATISSLTLTNVNGSQYCTIEVGGTSLTISSNLSGNGILDMEDDGGTVIINGNGSAFTGGANIAYGTFDVNGAFGSGITNFAGTTLEGSATCAGYVDVGEYGGSPFFPGGSNVVGTFTAAGLTLESGTTMTMDLKATTAMGGTNNDLVVVNGNLNVNGNTILINPIAGTLANGTYVLMTYTGTLNGSFAGVQTVAPSRYLLSLNITPTQVQLVVAGNPNTLVWNNGAGDGQWNVQASYDWTNLTKNIEDQFYTSDSVTFDDTISSAQTPTTSINLGSGIVVYPSAVTNNSSANNYTISGAGAIGGGASLVKMGTSTLTLTSTNSFTGNVSILGGTLLTGASNSLGSSSSGTVYVTNGATLDLGYSLGTKAMVIAGSGVSGGGALVNSIGSPIYDNPGGLQNITLTGNATIGGAVRTDFGKFTPGSGTVSSGGNNYSLTVLGGVYHEWDNVAFDTNFGNIYVMTTNGGSVGIKGATTLGNPTNTLAVFSNAAVTLYADTSTTPNVPVILNKTLMLYGGSTNQNGGGTNLILSPIVLGIASGDNCIFNVGGSYLTVSNVISGPGNLIKISSSPLILAGANTYTGNTVITTGPLDLVGAGSIADSANISLASSQVLDVSGRTDKTLTLASGQTLQGSGTINGNLVVGSGATVEPGINGSGTLTVTNIVTLQGNTTMSLGATVTNVLSGVSVNYGGSLNLTVVGSLSAGSSFRLFNSTKTNYAGAFSSITPATPGPGLAWNTSQLAVNGTLSVGYSPTSFGSYSISGTNLTFSGTGGTAGGTFYILTSTKVQGPWTTNGSGTFQANGNFSFTNGINSNTPAEFFLLKP